MANKVFIAETIVNRAVAIAGKCVGTVEIPKDSNRGKLIDVIQGEFGMKGQQYCGMFSVWAFKVALNEYGYDLCKGKGSLMEVGASSQSLFEYAKSKDCIYNTPSAGDIVIWRKLKLWQGHVGIVASNGIKDNQFITIEGNTSPEKTGKVVEDAEAQRNGGGIYKRTRYSKPIDWQVDSFYLRGFINMKKLLEQPGVVCPLK